MEHRIKRGAKGYAEPVKGKPGTFRLYFSLGKNPVTGKYDRTPKRTHHCRSKNPRNWPKECENALAAYRAELEGASRDERQMRTVGEYASDFHELRESEFKSPLSSQREAVYVRHITDMLGEIRLDDLRPEDIRRAYAEARREGMSESELHGTHVKLRQILQDAVLNEVIDKNPCDAIKLPKPTLKERAPLSAEEASRFLACLQEEGYSPNAVGTMIILQTGMRRGEMLGLTWGDYDPANRTVSISKQYTNDKSLRPPKSKMSRRTIAVNDALASYLDAWRPAQAESLSRYALPQDLDTPIVHGIGVRELDGESRAQLVRVDGHNFDRWFRNFCVDNGFGTYSKVTRTFMRDGKEHIRGTGYSGLVPHALRHTQATLLIGGGADVKTVQARLGHASANTTLQIYSHAIEANDRKAADAFGEIISK